MKNIDLSHLKGLHVPPSPDIFPLAIGWWLVILLLVVLMMGALYLFYRWRFSTKRYVKRRFDEIANLSDARSVLLGLNTLAKQVAIALYGRSKVAPLYEKEWIDLLNSTGSNIFSKEYVDLLQKSMYAKENIVPDSQKTRIISDYKKWFKKILKRLK